MSSKLLKQGQGDGTPSAFVNWCECIFVRATMLALQNQVTEGRT